MATLRAAVADDLQGILDIYNHAIEHTTAIFEYRPHTLDKRREWFKAKGAAGLPVVVAIEDDRVIGFASYGPFRAWPAYKYTVEHSVYVDVNCRGRGVGRALVNEMIAEARRRDMHAVIAGITTDNLPSLHLHRTLGFVEVAHFREVGYKFGHWLDLTFLQLLLDTPSRPTEP